MPDQDVKIRLERAKEKWRLKIGQKLSGGFRSEVFACATPDGQVVLKLMPTPQQAETEAVALKMWADTGAAVKLIDADLDNAALLVEELHPATPLSSTDESAAITVAADLLRALHAVLLYTKFPILEDIYPHLERRTREDARYEQEQRDEPDRGKPALNRLPAARELVRRLCNSAGKHVLLHGDFVTKNILLKGSNYTAIDPQPMVGDPCSDIGFFAADYPMPAHILRRAEAIAIRNNEDPLRAQQWAAVWAILQAAQAWRQDQADLEQFIKSETVERLLRA